MGKDNLLKEELQRHMELLEYTFYMEDTISNEDEVEDLILGAAEEINEQDPFGAGEEEIEGETEEETGDVDLDFDEETEEIDEPTVCLLYTSPSPRDRG